MMRIAIVVGAALWASAQAGAQGPTAPGTPLALLSKERVRKELKLTDGQAATVKKLSADARKDPRAAKKALETLGKTLEPKQYKRLEEISYQARGGAAVGDPKVARALKLTDKQKREVREIWVNEEKSLGMFLKVARFRNAAARQAFISNHRKKAGEKMLGVLDAAQQKQFAGLLGEKFDVTGLDAD
jgi:hypothetical protein